MSEFYRLIDVDKDNKELRKQLDYYKRKSKRLQQYKKQKEVVDKVYELIKQHIRKDGFLELNEWQTRDLLDILKEVENG